MGALACLGAVCYKYFLWIDGITVPFINFPAREINCKLVYYGPGLGGKTANLQWIYDHTVQNNKGKMISLATETDRTLFFDFLPLDLGTVRGFKTRFHLYTVPGQVFYEASRKLILKGACLQHDSLRPPTQQARFAEYPLGRGVEKAIKPKR